MKTPNYTKLVEYIFDYTSTQEQFLQQQERLLLEQQAAVQGQRAALMRFQAFMQTIVLRFEEAADSEEVAKLPDKSDDGIELQFTEKELNAMPKTFRKEFRVDGCTAHVRKRKTSANGYTYDIRYRRNGYNVSVTGRNLEDLKQRFIAALRVASPVPQNYDVPTVFNEFLNYWMESYHKEKVVAKTLYNHKNICKNWIFPAFDKIKITKITPKHCKDLLTKVKEAGHGKTADEIYSILNQTFRYAQAHHLVTVNPMEIIVHTEHEQETGKRLTLDEERRLLTECDERFRTIFAIYLYTGIRPGEIYSVKIDGEFIVCRNLKQKKGRVEWKKIPIIAKLRPYLEAPLPHFPKADTIRSEFNRILPNHVLKDTRRTFSSHCEECHVNDKAREKMLGHKPKNKLDVSYVELSDEYLLSEAKKIDY